MKKSFKETKDKDELFDELDPILKAFFEQAPTDDLGQGMIYNFWKSAFLLLTFSFYFLLLINSDIIKWLCVGYSVLMIMISAILIYGIKKEMIFKINPFDFATVQFINYVLLVFHYGFLFYSLYLINNNLFTVNGSINFFDFIYANITALATMGFADVIPNSTIIKVLFVIALIFSFWFLTTLIPIVLGLQTERIRQLTEAKNKFEREIKNAIETGRLKEVPDENAIENKE